ncbi:MAG: endonuclease VII domain-containing protein [Betaproteobacteria bacterium]|nr:endonuclease VII domain-containing protein [Betaproteobacteria bacterium]
MSQSDEKLTAKRERQRENLRRWRAKNPEEARAKARAYDREWRKGNAERAEYTRAYNQQYLADPENLERQRERNLKRHYGITSAQFNELWDAQDGCCAVCGAQLEPRGRTKKSAAIDHNHATGEVRGILCRGCNTGIGNLRDDPEIIKAAAEYLIRKGNYAHLRKALD